MRRVPATEGVRRPSQSRRAATKRRCCGSSACGRRSPRSDPCRNRGTPRRACSGRAQARECFLVAKRARGAQSPWQVKWTTQDNPPARAAEVPLRCQGDPAVPPAARAVALASASRGCRLRSRRRSRSTLLVGRTAGVSELVGIRPAASPARTRASVSRRVSRGRSSRVTPARWKLASMSSRDRYLR